MYNAFDCNFPLRQDTAMLAFASGMRYVGQYLSSNYKGLTVQAAAGIKVSGLKILSIYERDPVGAAYFTAANAAYDAEDAHEQTQRLLQPHGSSVYFTVDYDASEADLPAIAAYFGAIRRAWPRLEQDEPGTLYGDLKAGDFAFLIGAYGSGLVLQHLLDAGLIERTWLSQSTAFAGYQAFVDSGRANVIQGPQVSRWGIPFDEDTVATSEIGWVPTP